MTRSENFYSELATLNSFFASTDPKNHSALPPDWLIVVADIEGSTAAIAEGRYKQINTVGACTIMALLNIDRSIEIPYVFGGDGAILAVPPSLEIAAREALLGCQKLAREGLGLALRVGLVPVSDLTKEGLWVRVGKFQLSEHLVQAALSGRGWEKAEALVKDPRTRSAYEVVQTDGLQPKANFDGFECRWNSIKSRGDHKICLIVQAVASSPAEQKREYLGYLNKIAEIYGSQESHHPLSASEMTLAVDPKQLSQEAKIQTFTKARSELIYVLRSLLENILGRWLLFFKVNTRNTKWSNYLGDLVANSDFRKFDGALKMVMDGSEAQESKLREYMEQRFAAGQLVYGIHTCPEAILTCLIFSYNGQHAHFVDGSDGGYAIAARDFKQRLFEWQSRRKVSNF